MVLTDKNNMIGFCYTSSLDNLEWSGNGYLHYGGLIYRLIQFEIQGDFAIMELEPNRIKRN